ncbi:MAG: FAD-dependent oxidoreductase [Acidobacteriota bacterium]
MNRTSGRETDVLIVGGGLCGLIAARSLAESGVQAEVLDKGRGVGGRLATRRIGPGRADHGAQFLTAESPLFRRMVRAWHKQGLVSEWCTGWSEGSISSDRTEAIVRWAVPGGMNTLARHLAEGLDARPGTRVSRLESANDGTWHVHDDAGGVHRARVVVLTPPVPQTLELLEVSGLRLPYDESYALRRVSYTRCLVGMFWFEDGVDIPEPGLLEGVGDGIAFIADNRRKGVSPEALLITVQAASALSDELYEAADDVVLDRLEAALAPYRARSAVVRERQLKRWRYALPVVRYPDRALRATIGGRPPLILAGDGFGGLRIEGAALSGLRAAELATESLGR